MQQIINRLKNLGDLQSLCSRSLKDTAAIGVASGAKTNIISSYKGFVLIVTNDTVSASKLYEDLTAYGKKVVIVSSKEEVLLYNRAFSREETFKRLSALYSIISGQCDTAIITADSLCRRFPPQDKFLRAGLVIEKNKDYNIQSVVKQLILCGYSREAVVESKGQFAMRGDIFDIFPVNCDNPVRIDFFDTLAESIKYFDTESGKSYEKLEKIDIAPATDILLDDNEIPLTLNKIKQSRDGIKVSGEHKKRSYDICADIISRIENGDREYSLNFILPFLEGESNLRQYLPPNSAIIFDDSKLLSDKLILLYKEHESRYRQLLSYGEILPESYFQYADKDKVFSQFEGLFQITFNALNTEPFYKAEYLNIKTSPVTKYSLNFNELRTDISNWLYNGYKVFICCKDDEGIKELKEELYSGGTEISEDINETKLAVALPIGITEGFISHSNKFVLIGYFDIFIKKSKKTLKRKKKDVFLSPEIGDHIVHDLHGIGICKGIQNLKAGTIAKDYIVIEYNGGDILYVPCDQMDLIAKYSGSDTMPKLNKLGGREFEKIKNKVKRQIKEMAFDLKNLYAERESRRGYAFSADSPMQKDFEEAFPYDETEDQLKAAAEIKSDMENPRIMDRLLCGDVGYGKTEVSLRAAFKAVIDGKQVAMLAPTTILTQQHYNLCVTRFAGFGINIEVLNRFKTKSEQDDTLLRLKEGKIDIIIGTHRLLSKDVQFKDLGLLIVDEEQRFGVEAKENIKNINKQTDVLTLSATPIPRTLHMSLSGIRDISVLDTPPRERLPVQTYVLEYSEGLISDAVNRELARGGQVFILYNRVDSIEGFAAKVKRVAPSARVITAHGQMKEDNLENAVISFYNGNADVLVCTTIIENGIDIPNVNTLIVCEADRLGLSQLYQLRGRVGRGNRLAHVYFTYVPEKVLTENAYKRLKAIMEYTEFGSGFKIAMRDLEIRGAGNVLGKQQHGHIENVGYDMYLRLLKAAMSDGSEEQQGEITVEIAVDSYVPEKYIEDNAQRMRVYQKISSMEEGEKEELINEIKDIYGEIPQPVLNLIDIRLIKIFAAKANTEAVIIKPKNAKIVLKDMDALKNTRLLDAVEKHSDICSLSFAEKPEIQFAGKYNSVKMLKIITNFLSIAVKQGVAG